MRNIDFNTPLIVLWNNSNCWSDDCDTVIESNAVKLQFLNYIKTLKMIGGLIQIMNLFMKLVNVMMKVTL